MTISLDVIDVPDPCPADWNAMAGNHRVRFCGQCKLNVYNLSAMTRAEAEALITEKEGRLCAQFIRRADRTIVTADCGWRSRTRRAGTAVAMAFAAVVFGLLNPLGFSREEFASGRALAVFPPARLIESILAQWSMPRFNVARGGVRIRPTITDPSADEELAENEWEITP